MTVRTAPMELAQLVAIAGRPFGIYIHVPFCATRCGYCDFNTYTPAELGGANPSGWLEALRAELGLAASRLASPHRLGPPHVRRQVDTVFVGGGRPRCWVATVLRRCSMRSAHISRWPRTPR